MKTPIITSESLFTAGGLAAVLGLSSRAIRKRLRGAVAELAPERRGLAAKGWPWTALPTDWQEVISALAARKGYKSGSELLADIGSQPWQPPIPLDSVPEKLRLEAEQWRSALLPILPRQHDLPPGELLRLGMLESNRVFGRDVAESTWRRHFDLAVKRDNGFEQWARVDLYLAEEAFAHYSPGPGAPAPAIEPEDLAQLTDAFTQVANPSKLTTEDRDFVWAALLGSQAPKGAVLDYAFKSLPGLARTRKGLSKAYRRKMNNPEDRRRGKSGRKPKKLCPDCALNTTGAAVDLDGDIAQAWRRMNLEKKLCGKCAALWHFNVRTNKSYVPLAVRNQVGPAVAAAAPWRHGPKRVRLLSPYVLRRRDIGPGDVFEADDVTFNHLFWMWNTNAKGYPYVGRGECLLFMDRGSWYPLGYRLIAGAVDAAGRQVAARYTGEDIRLGVLRVHDSVGLPRRGFQIENGIWRSRLVAGQQVTGWKFNPWRDFEAGLNEEGIVLGGTEKAVRHALPGNPRTKIIERAIRSVQERMRPLPGFVGFNHRDYKPEILNDFLRRVTAGKENPAEMFLSFKQYRDILDSELMAYAEEAQNGRWLPGVSPLEVWKNGIGQFPGVAQSPLRKLAPTARYKLSTHWQELPVGGQGIRFEFSKRPFVFWGDELIPWMHKTIPVRWNIEEPELLHCLPPGGTPFTMKSREINSWTATADDLSRTGADRNRWDRHSRAIFDNLPHPLLSQVTRDTEHTADVHAVGEAINRATQEHREQKALADRESRRLDALAGTLGIKVKDGEIVTQRAIEARQRRLARDTNQIEGVL